MTAIAYLITGPTSGYGQRAALELAAHGTVILVGRNRAKLDAMQTTIEQRGQHAVVVVCDLADPASVARAAAEVVALGLPIAGVLNNAGVMQQRPTKTARGWDTSFATNHLGPFALTEALADHLRDGTTVVFVVSAVEDPNRGPAKLAGFRGGRYVSAEASARGEWAPGGAKNVGMDAYATSKQAALASAMELAREQPRLRINAVEPGFSPSTGLGRDAGKLLQLIGKAIFTVLGPFVKGSTTPKQASRLLASLVLNAAGETGVYYDEHGRPMQGSALVRDPQFQQRVVAETRALLAAAHSAKAPA